MYLSHCLIINEAKFNWSRCAEDLGIGNTLPAFPVNFKNDVLLIRVPKGFRASGLRPKMCGTPGLQDKNIGAPGLHNISFGAPGFTVIKYSGLQVSKSSGLQAPQLNFQGSRDPLWDPDLSMRYLHRILCGQHCNSVQFYFVGGSFLRLPRTDVNEALYLTKKIPQGLYLINNLT